MLVIVTLLLPKSIMMNLRRGIGCLEVSLIVTGWGGVTHMILVIMVVMVILVPGG